jgi:hypothetical protein
VTSRQKIVAFRLRAEEYEDLKRAVTGDGSFNLSEFARLAIFYRVAYLEEMRSRLCAVVQELQKLTADVTSLASELMTSGAKRNIRDSNDK